MQNLKYVWAASCAAVIGGMVVAEAGTLSPDAYVRSGLTNQWDGADGLTAERWADRVGGENLVVSEKSKVSVDGNAARFNGGSWYQGLNVLPASTITSWSAEVHFKVNAVRSGADNHIVGTNGGGGWTFLQANGHKFCFVPRYNGSYKWVGETKTLGAGEVLTSCGISEPTSATFYRGDCDPVTLTGLTKPDNGVQMFRLGASGNQGNGFDGWIYAARLYNRALTADEVAWNKAIDKVRFQGADVSDASLWPATLPDGYRRNVSSGAIECRLTVQKSDKGAVTVNGAVLESDSEIWLTLGSDETVGVEIAPFEKNNFTGWKLNGKPVGSSYSIDLPGGRSAGTLQAAFGRPSAYVETTGTQYFLTDFCADAQTKVELELMPTKSVNQQRFFGADADDATLGLSCSSYQNGSSLFASAAQDGKGNWTSSGYAVASGLDKRILMTLDVYNRADPANYTYSLTNCETAAQLVSGSVKTTRSLAAKLPLAIAADNQPSGISNLASERIYSLRIWRKGLLARCYVPYWNEGKTVVGLKDLVTGTVIENAGSGTLGTGGDLPVDPNCYLPEGYAYDSESGKVVALMAATCDEGAGTVRIGDGEAGTSVEKACESGAAVVFVATPAPGYVFCGWTGDNDDFTFDQYRSPSITVAGRVRTLRAEFRVEGANIHTVPGDFSSLAEALASPLVKDGDTIQLADGTHAFAQEATVGSYTYLAKIDRFVTVRGSSPDNAVLDCGGGGGLYIDHPAALVEGVTIQNFQRIAPQSFALDFQRGVVSNACVSGRSGKCMKVEGSIPAIRSFEGAVFEDCMITNVNKQQWDSSGIIVAKGTTFRRTTFYGNAAFNYILQVAALNGVRSRVENCTFAKNSDYYRPMITGSDVDVVDCVFYGNSSSDAGAGLSLSGVCTFDRCVVTNNTLNGSCPLVACGASSQVYATNCLFAANKIANWGAFKLGGKDVRLELVNCTVAANKTTSSTYCGGITGDGASGGRATVRFLNTAFWNNTANGVVKNFLDSYLYTDFDFDNSCFTGIVPTSGAGNTVSDPDFADPAAGDYRPGENSSCVDTGADLPVVPVDLDGRERPIDGTGGTNPKWDIGCYEAAAREIPVQCSLKVLGSEGTWPCPMTQTVTVVGSRLTGLSYEWLAIRMENGVPVTNRQVTAVAENVFEGLPVGVYSFVCTVSNDRGDAASSRVDDAFTTLVGTCYVSNEGSDTFPYTNAATAARNLSSAISVASERIVIAPGEYGFDHYVDEQTGYDTMGAVYRAVAIEAGEAAEDVVLDCSGKGGLILANAGASLHGVTFRNYQTAQSAPVLYLKSGTASDIVVSGGGVALKGGECVYIGELAEVENLVVTNHRARAVNVVGGTLRKAQIRDCQAGASSVVSTSKSTHDIGSALEDVEVRACRTTSAAIFALGYCDAVRCTFAGNTNANKNAYCVSLDMSRLSDSRIVRNSAQCAVAVKTEWMTSYSIWLRNCLVAENQTTSRAAVAAPTTCQYFLLENCTVIGNAADTAPAGGTQLAYSSYANHLKMVNCIIWGNTTGGAPADVAPGGNDFIYQNCCFREAADEVFVTSASCKNNLACDAGVKRNGKLTRLSPCRDAGQVLSWHATGHDIDGNPRVLDAEKGGRVDIGCYENPPGPGLAIFVR